jgi:hypothetical protein
MIMRKIMAYIGDDEAYDLTNYQRFIRLSEDGLGMAPLHRLSERGPLQHGQTDRGFRLDPRVLNLVIGLFGQDDHDYWNARQELLYIFGPRNEPIKLRYFLPNGEIRQLDVHYQGQMSFGSNERFRVAHRVGIALLAPDPTWYDPEEREYVFSLVSQGFRVSTRFPTSFGGAELDQSKELRYQGSWLSYPIIKIVGPIQNPIVYNDTTGEKISLDGTTIVDDFYYEIDTRYGFKTVYDSNGNNRLSRLTTDSDLAMFHLAGKLEAPTGVNLLRVTGENITPATQIFFRYYERYIGI